MSDYFSWLPQEILPEIISHCDLDSLRNLAQTQHKFHDVICTERTWKEQSLRLWEKNVKEDVKYILHAVEVIKTIKWKRILKCVSNTTKKGLGFDVNTKYWKFKAVTLSKFEDGNLVVDPKAIRMYIHVDEIVHYGEFVNKADGNGFGSKFYDKRSFIGQMVSRELTKGKIIWSNGYEYEGEFFDEQPKETEKCVPPEVIKCIEDNVCTFVATKNVMVPQVVGTFCYTCKMVFCLSCTDHNQDCSCVNNMIVQKTWIPFAFCDCQSEHCKKPKK
eukprot:TRINITY_DN5382_c0_g1_i1.p1 TRINITY_DN5382_c0_g1~~TRINITY_DN5382_c0_g1_i1.p1  ORF type:complete len:284 (-),score=41.86 TRINITY_DN5382_c0_g1_i1:20-841(-)